MKNVAVFGVGKWGINFLRIFKKLKVLCYFFDKDKKNVCVSFKSKEDILKDKNIKHIIISTPISTHFSIAQECILSGKNIFVEKPLSTSVKEIRILNRLSKKYKKYVMCGHLLVYNPIFIRLQRIINSGYIGNILKIYSIRTCVEDGSYDIIWDFGPHDISMIFKLISSNFLDFNIISFKFYKKFLSQVFINIIYKNTSIKIFLSFNFKKKIRKFKVIGENKSIIFDDLEFLKDKLIVLNNKKNYKLRIKFLRKEPLLNECQCFLGFLKKNKASDILNSEKIINFISLIENKIKIYK